MAEILRSSENDLCEICRSYRLRECFYPLNNREYQQFRCKWDTFIANLHTCILCKLIYDSVCLHEEFQKFQDQLHFIDLLFLNVGTLDWKLDRQNGTGKEVPYVNRSKETPVDRNSRTVRSLRIDAFASDRKPLLNVRIYPVVDKSSSLKDRLLHFREISDTHADLSLATQWIEICDSAHGSKCKPSIWEKMGESGLCMVDVKERRIVSIDQIVEYLVLSYCWGNVNDCLQLIKSNRQELGVKGSLGDVRADLPQTIRDAIRLTFQLGCRYLWVDALCICQDDKENKMKQILQMDKIYQHAKLTIVAAAGRNSWSGLSGLSISNRNVQRITETIDGMTLTSSYPQQDFAISLAESAWASRAWTFQEHLLSSRLLFFGQDELFWECECSRFAESLHLECVDPEMSVQLRSTISYSTKQIGNISSFQRYNVLVERVTRRNLGNEMDRLNCMQGLMNTMENDFPGGFFWGLPIATFDSSLLFQAGPFDEAPLERNEGFPSWSWAGWVEETDTQVTSLYDRYPAGAVREPLGFWSDMRTREPAWLRKEVAWFHLDKEGRDWEPIQSVYISQQGSVYYEESIARWNKTSPHLVLKATKERFAEADVPLSHALIGWAQTAHLSVDRDRADVEGVNQVGLDHLQNGHGNGFAIRAPGGQAIGYINLGDEYRQSEPDQLCFILLSQHRRFEEHLGPLFDILHVESLFGVTFRVQGVRDCTLDHKIWKSLDVNWELITMG